MKKEILVFVLLISLISATSAISEEQCSQIYWFILGNNYIYSEQDLQENNLTQINIENYFENCYLEGFEQLPNKPINTQTYEEESISCDVGVGFFNSSIPLFFQIPLNIENGCKSVNFWNMFFHIDKNNYEIDEVKLSTIILFTFLLVVFVILSSDKIFNKIIDRNL